MSFSLYDFVAESNRIEGILREPNDAEMTAHDNFLTHFIGLSDELEKFVSVVAPGKKLRRSRGMNVRVGSHIAPPGGPEIETELDSILRCLIGTPAHQVAPYEVHQRYERLHPFMDGNGRSGRVLWLWMMGGIDRAPLGFLHHWYYQSLEASR